MIVLGIETSNDAFWETYDDKIDEIEQILKKMIADLRADANIESMALMDQYGNKVGTMHIS